MFDFYFEIIRFIFFKMPSLQQSQQLAVSASNVISQVIKTDTDYSHLSGPKNEVWKGKLHVRLKEGGHIYIEVAILSYYVPLTINL